MILTDLFKKTQIKNMNFTVFLLFFEGKGGQPAIRCLTQMSIASSKFQF